MPSRVLQRALSYCFLIWSSLVILSKMIYQLRFVQADLFQHNCTDQVSQDKYSVLLLSPLVAWYRSCKYLEWMFIQWTCLQTYCLLESQSCRHMLKKIKLEHTLMDYKYICHGAILCSLPSETVLSFSSLDFSPEFISQNIGTLEKTKLPPLGANIECPTFLVLAGFNLHVCLFSSEFTSTIFI